MRVLCSAGLLSCAAFAAGCHHDTHDTSHVSPDDTVDSGTTDLSCAKLEIDFDGPDPPYVGDSWDLHFWCDGALITVAVIRFDPPTLASVEEFTATFLEAGDGTLTMQYGAQREEKELTVLKSP